MGPSTVGSSPRTLTPSAGTAYLYDPNPDPFYEIVAETDIRLTDGGMRFRFTNVPAGEYIIDTLTDNTAYTYGPGTSSLKEAIRYAVKEGERLDVDIVVRPPAQIRVTLHGDPQVPLDFPSVFAINTDVRRVLEAGLGWGASGPTSIEGNVVTVGEGSWYVGGSNYDPDKDLHWNYFPEWQEDAGYSVPWRGGPVTLDAGEVIDVTVTLEPFWRDMYNNGHPFGNDIFWMQRTGLTYGCSDDLFCTDSSLTRGEMAAFLSRALRLPRAPDSGFTDVDDSEYAGDIDRIAAAGITLGCNPPQNDRFCPAETVERGQMAAFLVRAMGYEEASRQFVDDDDSVFEDDIEKLATAGVTQGCNPPDNDRFCPGSNVSRGEMAAFLRRATSGILQPNEVNSDRPETAANRRLR